ncbi:histidinol-phosphate aminotransferase [Synechococcus elongatus PCC 6301]|uniref:threonine-phosphate decarboxylase n=1 Tax=Synechococcus sp. (strain ATCC 27144 / PCC 6301 / SAUG 1402/1) TaxID=269084 RepID=A0A0H3K3E2_SYNP6|nr:threonine-phosphate decarboxylase CobD [Synechococcus elongatus]BAD78630.1 histidinol-phosphate aminotransferase [Synechococcus elongatus PCC 6301]
MTRPNHGGNLRWAAGLAGASPADLLDFSASLNPLGPPAWLATWLQQHYTHLIAYPDPQYRQLREAIARHHDCDPDWILPGNGAAELLTRAARDLAACREVLLLGPAFRDYERALTAVGVPWRRLALPLDRPASLATLRGLLEPQLTPETGLLINNPHNPTGWLWPLRDLWPLLQRCRLVVADEAFLDFLPTAADWSLQPCLAQSRSLVIVRSLTKFYSLAGLRLGYAIAHPDRLESWQQWRDPWSVNGLAAALGPELLADHDFQAATWNWLPPARAALASGLASIPGLRVLPSQANFLLVQAEDSILPLQERLLQQHRLLIRDCLSFTELGDRWFRVAVRSSAENQRLLEAIAAELA